MNTRKNSRLTSIAIASGLAFASLALAPQAANAAEYDIDPGHTFVVFSVGHFGVGKAYGMFRKTTGKFDPDAGTVEVSIDADSVFTADKKRDDHIKGPDFFNAKQFPTLTFKSKKVTKKGKKLLVTGDLSIKGKTKSVTLEMMKIGEGKDPFGNYRAGFEGTLKINRMDFGIDYMPDGLSKEVTLQLAVEGIKKK